MASILERPRSIQQRNADATSHLREVLALDDLKLLSTALAEISADEAKRNSTFAERVRTRYRELATLKSIKASKSSNRVTNATELIPIKKIEGVEFDPYAKLDPYLICDIYGHSQLRAAMTGFSLGKLKEAIEFVQAKHPGTKPKTKSRKEDIIDYVVTYVKGAE